jgi:SAM-dependent methyltransferase
VLDLACGRGRHVLAVRRAGGRVVAMDRSAEALRALRAAAGGPDVLPVRTDLEDGHGIPARDAAFGAVLVFRYLHRPLAPEIERVLRPGGLLLYETFTAHQRDLPHGPGNPDFLLEPGELPTLFPGLVVLAHEETCTPGPRPEHLARLAARRS